MDQNTKLNYYINQLTNLEISQGALQICEALLDYDNKTQADINDEIAQLVNYFSTKYAFEFENITQSSNLELFIDAIKACEKKEQTKLTVDYKLELIIENYEQLNQVEDFENMIINYKNTSNKSKFTQKQLRDVKIVSNLLLATLFTTLGVVIFSTLLIVLESSNSDSDTVNILTSVSKALIILASVALFVLATINITKLNQFIFKPNMIVATSILTIVSSMMPTFVLFFSIPLFIVTIIAIIDLENRKRIFK